MNSPSESPESSPPSPVAGVPEKTGIFMSYHHENDEFYYDHLCPAMKTDFSPIRDNPSDRIADGDDPEAVVQRIRDSHIQGTRCTLVLCGEESGLRKYIDWEIKGTLDKGNGLIGIVLPTCERDPDGKFVVPDRLYDNVSSGYALLINWSDLFPSPLFELSLPLGAITPQNTDSFLKGYVDAAMLKPASLIVNTREKMEKDVQPL